MDSKCIGKSVTESMDLNTSMVLHKWQFQKDNSINCASDQHEHEIEEADVDESDADVEFKSLFKKVSIPKLCHSTTHNNDQYDLDKLLYFTPNKFDNTPTLNPRHVSLSHIDEYQFDNNGYCSVDEMTSSTYSSSSSSIFSSQIHHHYHNGSNYHYSHHHHDYNSHHNHGHDDCDDNDSHHSHQYISQKSHYTLYSNDYSDTPSPTSSIGSDIGIPIYNFNEDSFYGENQNSLTKKKSSLINYDDEDEIDYKINDNIYGTNITNKFESYKIKIIHDVMIEDVVTNEADEIEEENEKENVNDEEKDQIFGLGITIPSLGGSISSNCVHNYISTLEKTPEVEFFAKDKEQEQTKIKKEEEQEEVTEGTEERREEDEDEDEEEEKNNAKQNSNCLLVNIKGPKMAIKAEDVPEIKIKYEDEEEQDEKKIEGQCKMEFKSINRTLNIRSARIRKQSKMNGSKVDDPVQVPIRRKKRKLKSRNVRKTNNKNLKKGSNNNDDHKSKIKLPFVCEECGKGFPRKSNHDSHIRMHLTFKPHKCNFCSKGFVRKSDLNRHERSLHLDSTFKCSGRCDENDRKWGCGHVYSRKDGLRKHWKSLQGKQCLLQFLYNNNLHDKMCIDRDFEKIIELTKLFDK